MNSSIEEKIEELNRLIKKKLWFDFEVVEYKKSKLTIAGGLDPYEKVELEIYFTEIFFLSLPFEWQTDTSKDILQVMHGSDATKINLRFHTDIGYSLFRFTPERYDDNFGCLVAAKSLDYAVISPNDFL